MQMRPVPLVPLALFSPLIMCTAASLPHIKHFILESIQPLTVSPAFYGQYSLGNGGAMAGVQRHIRTPTRPKPGYVCMGWAAVS